MGGLALICGFIGFVSIEFLLQVYYLAFPLSDFLVLLLQLIYQVIFVSLFIILLSDAFEFPYFQLESLDLLGQFVIFLPHLAQNHPNLVSFFS